MKRRELVLLVMLFVLCSGGTSCAAEHGGKEHGGKEHGGKEHAGKAIAEPTAEDIRAAMKQFVEEESSATGAFDVMDDETGQIRKLNLVRIHDRVGKTGAYYYSCADFRDITTDQLIDVDLDVEYERKDGALKVVDVRIHKVDGVERYTYDENDNRVPVGR